MHCPGVIVCEPRQKSFFDRIDDVCLYIFTIDYLSRILTCWTVSPRLAGMAVDALDTRSKLSQFVTYFFRFHSIIDLVSIAPFYVYWIVYRQVDHEMSGFVRVLRIPRILRILNVSKRFGSVNVLVEVLRKTLEKSSKALSFTLFYVGLGTIVFAAIVFLLEQGTFVVNGAHPHGEWLREDAYGNPRTSPTTFVDMAVSMYFVIVTLTTLGYGDLVTTSPGGRAFSSLLCFTGILVLALPIAVVGHNFVELYRQYVTKMHNINTTQKIDLKRAKMRRVLAKAQSEGVKSARDVNHPVKMDLCEAHEKFCSFITDKSERVAQRAADQSEDLQRTFYDIQAAMAMIAAEVGGPLAHQDGDGDEVNEWGWGDADVDGNLDDIPPASTDLVQPPAPGTAPGGDAGLPRPPQPAASSGQGPGGVAAGAGAPATSAKVDAARRASLLGRSDVWPWYIPALFPYRSARPDMFYPVRTYELFGLQRIFVFFEHPKACVLGTVYFVLLISVIVLGVASLVLATERVRTQAHT
jgi:hypothetical protein